MLNSDVIKSIYDYNLYKLPSMNREIREYKYDILNKKVSKIQKWYKRNKIDRQMPILFISEIDLYQKWYIIRLYMKFYPKEDLLEWPMHCTRKVKQTRKYDNEILLSINKAYQVFEFMKKQTKRNIISTGF